MKTDEYGKFTLRKLPPGDYVLAVNGDEYYDKSPIPPTFYPGVQSREKAGRVVIREAESKHGIDLVLPSPRLPVTVIIEASYPDGKAAVGASVSTYDAGGVQRSFALDQADKSGVIRLLLYRGETRLIKVWDIAVDSAGGGREMRIRRWQSSVGPLVLDNAEMHIRVILREVSD
jgi:hypothetical protein